VFNLPKKTTKTTANGVTSTRNQLLVFVFELINSNKTMKNNEASIKRAKNPKNSTLLFPKMESKKNNSKAVPVIIKKRN